MLKSYHHTRTACYIGYVTQAEVANFIPLLFLIFKEQFNVSVGQLTALVTVTFVVQLLVDLISSEFVDKIGYRPCIVAAHVFASLGLIGLALFPRVMPPYAGMILAVVIYAVGGGLIEVLVSPIVEACPAKNKAGQMSLLHSFYCWGSAFVIAFSTGFLALFGKGSWWICSLVWAAVPLLNAVYFMFVPIAKLTEEGEGMNLRELFGTKSFWLFAFLIALAGASELAVSQWVSAFAESGLGVTKAVGDLAGPCLFAVCMGGARVLYAKLGGKLNLRRGILCSGILCVASYLVVSLVQSPAVALAGCAVCGFSVGIMWPGVFSMASASIPRGGTAMFALLALMGDLGCTVGPTLVGAVTDAAGGDFRTGILCASVFPVLLVALLSCCRPKKGGTEKSGDAQG